MFVRERERVFVSESKWVCERESERVCVSMRVNVCAREREKSACPCVSVCACVLE